MGWPAGLGWLMVGQAACFDAHRQASSCPPDIATNKNKMKGKKGRRRRKDKEERKRKEVEAEKEEEEK